MKAPDGIKYLRKDTKKGKQVFYSKNTIHDENDGTLIHKNKNLPKKIVPWKILDLFYRSSQAALFS